jgi:PrgI family protein
MAVYKVPQDVEAEDKLIGPFSFRQFIYLIIALIAVALAWGLGQLFIPLAVIPLPIVIFFGALALPLRKDQPMEIYLAAVVSFYLKPRRRLWQPDGIQSLVEITAPKIVEIQRAKDLTETEAQRRLSYLADIVDTGGWSVRGVTVPVTDSSMQTDAYYAAQQVEDILDDSGGVSRSLDTMITQSDTKRHQEMMQRMQQAPTESTQPAMPITPPDPYASLSPVAPPQQDDPHLTYNPYPASIHQTVVTPLSERPPVAAAPQMVAPPQPAISAQPIVTAQVPATTSEKPISPDIINLANNTDLSIETIAHEANRIHEKEGQLSSDEVTISLR